MTDAQEADRYRLAHNPYCFHPLSSGLVAIYYGAYTHETLAILPPAEVLPFIFTNPMPAIAVPPRPKPAELALEQTVRELDLEPDFDIEI